MTSHLHRWLALYRRYFDYHHTEADRMEAVNQRELELGAASMTSLVYLLDKYGL